MCVAHVGHHDLIVRDKQFFRFVPSQRLETFVDILPLLWISEAPEPTSSAESLRQKHPWSSGLPTMDLHCCWDLLLRKRRNSVFRRGHCAHPDRKSTRLN